MITRTERQKECIRKWIDSNGMGTVEAATGFGKTRLTLMLIDKLLKRSSNASVLIVVPTEFLKEQWLDQLDEWKLSDNTRVEIINTVVKKEWTCDLLVIDEVHLVATETYKQVFESVDYKMILCLTATLKRLDGKEVIIKEKAPVCDTISLSDALNNGWVSPIKEYVVLLQVDDIDEYVKLDKVFNGYFAYFDWDFNIAMKCCRDWRFRNTYANQMGLDKKEILSIAMGWMHAMSKRRNFVMSHPKKIEVCKKILKYRKDKKCITFSATIKDAQKLKVGKVLHSKQSKKENSKIIEEFNNAECGVLCTSKAADQGVDLKGLSVGIIMSVDSSKIRKTQRVGRIIRFEPGKVAELFTLIIKDTQEWRWFQNSNSSANVIVLSEDDLDIVLKNQNFNTRPRDLIEDTKYRF